MLKQLIDALWKYQGHGRKWNLENWQNGGDEAQDEILEKKKDMSWNNEWN
jgi:hypothetical protein